VASQRSGARAAATVRVCALRGRGGVGCPARTGAECTWGRDDLAGRQRRIRPRPQHTHHRRAQTITRVRAGLRTLQTALARRSPPRPTGVRAFLHSNLRGIRMPDAAALASTAEARYPACGGAEQRSLVDAGRVAAADDGLSARAGKLCWTSVTVRHRRPSGGRRRVRVSCR
jgi:hypothetical protein